jgi:hypothetical protein
MTDQALGACTVSLPKRHLSASSAHLPLPWWVRHSSTRSHRSPSNPLPRSDSATAVPHPPTLSELFPRLPTTSPRTPPKAAWPLPRSPVRASPLLFSPSRTVPAYGRIERPVVRPRLSQTIHPVGTSRGTCSRRGQARKTIPSLMESWTKSWQILCSICKSPAGSQELTTASSPNVTSTCPCCRLRRAC